MSRHFWLSDAPKRNALRPFFPEVQRPKPRVGRPAGAERKIYNVQKKRV